MSAHPLLLPTPARLPAATPWPISPPSSAPLQPTPSTGPSIPRSTPSTSLPRPPSLTVTGPVSPSPSPAFRAPRRPPLVGTTLQGDLSPVQSIPPHDRDGLPGPPRYWPPRGPRRRLRRRRPAPDPGSHLSAWAPPRTTLVIPFPGGPHAATPMRGPPLPPAFPARPVWASVPPRRACHTVTRAHRPAPRNARATAACRRPGGM